MSQKELQRVAVISSCVKGDLACARAASLLTLRRDMSNDSNLGYGKAGRRLWHTPAADGPVIVACRIACATASCSWPAPPMPASTTIISAKNCHEIEGFSLGRETLRRLLRSAGIGSPRKRRAPTHRQRRLARAREGEMLLLDASLHRWLEDRGPQLTLLGFLDDATRKVPVAEFFPTEDARGYFRLLHRLLRRYGVPLSFYGDRHSVFLRNDDHWSLQEQLSGRREPTQFGRALQQLGVTYIAAQSPQAKGRIERLWGTFQDRLTSELRLAGAYDLESANQVLRRFLSDYNRRFARAPRQAEKAYRPAPENLDRICCFHHQRSVGNDNIVQWDGRCFQIPPQPHRFSFAGAKVQLVESLEGKISIYYGDNKLHHQWKPRG